MKKILAWLLLAATILSLWGCGKGSQQPEATTIPAETVAAETTAAETQAPTMEAEEAEDHLFLKVSAITFSVVGESENIYLGMVSPELVTWESDDPNVVSVENGVLTANGVSEDKISKFSVEYDEAFGFEAELHPRNVIDQKRFEVKTPDVTIHVNPESTHLVETRVIEGVKYILICADDNVEVNGVNINITEA